MEVEFVMDDNEHVWLSNVPKCFVYEADANSPPYLLDEGDREGNNGKTTLTGLMVARADLLYPL